MFLSPVYISLLIRLAIVYSNVSDFNSKHFLTANVLKQKFDIINFVKNFLNSTTDSQS